MDGTRKSLGQFLADVLATVSGATYIPAGVIVAGTALAVTFATSDSTNPIDALATASAPGFATLATFVIVVAVVAALLEPIQFWVTRALEGHIGPWPDWRYSRYRRLWESLHAARFNNGQRLSEAKENLVRLGVDDGARAELAQEIDNLERSQADLSERLRQFPSDPARILPTRLGNIVRSYEDRAEALLAAATGQVQLPGRGGMQDLLPFAYFAIPSETRVQHDRFRSQLQAAATLTMAIPVVGLVLARSVAHFHVGWAGAALVVTVLLTISAVAGARGAGDGYGTMLVAIAEQFRAGVIDVERSAADGEPTVQTAS